MEKQALFTAFVEALAALERDGAELLPLLSLIEGYNANAKGGAEG